MKIRITSNHKVMQNNKHDKDDWYRRTSWNSEAQETFFERFKRSRSHFHKAQYLRIQAHYLQEKYPGDALKLLDKIREEFPEPSELASTYLQTAQCLIVLGKKEEAISWFRKVLEHEENHKGIQTHGYLDFPVFIVTEEKKELYREAKEILEKYQWNMVMALIKIEEGDQSSASGHAREAIKASKENHSGFRYHPTVGLAKKQDERIQKLLTEIAKA